MKILLVEDNESFADNLIATLIEENTNIKIQTAKSRDSALSAISDHFFDLIILDLKIPTVDDELDVDVDHGQAVFYQAQTSCPGTPIYILTGSEPDHFCLDLARHGTKIDLWGTGTQIPGVIYFAKDNADRLAKEVVDLASLLAGTNQIIVNTRGKSIHLQPEQKRMLRVFTRANQGSSCEIIRLGGLSNALVLKVVVRDSNQNTRTLCVAKLGLSDDINNEIESYENEVKNLKMGSFAPLIRHLKHGLRNYAGAFYSLAEDYDHSFFDTVRNNVSNTPNVVNQIRQGLDRWCAAKEIRKVKISHIRRRLLSDEALIEIISKHELTFVNLIEDLEIEASFSCIHGDLHGSNILVNSRLDPVLIDFGDVGEGCTCLDPVTLELSMLFHPDGKNLGLTDQLLRLINNWPDVDSYTDGNKLKPAIAACRDWAHDVGGGDKAVLAAGYAFAIRQLKYDTVAPAHIINLLNNIANKLGAEDD